jgi:type IV pilus assembly protein PilN
MIRINLLPYRAARSKENIRRQVSIFCLSLVLLLIVLWVLNGYLGGQVKNYAARLEDLKKEVKRYEEKAHQVETIKQKLNSLKKKIEIVNQLKAYRKSPPQLLAEMTEMVVPDRMQLTSLESRSDMVALNGIALDNETVAVFMTRLERSPRFSSVTLKSAKQQTKYNIPMKVFQIVCKKAAGQQPDKDKADKK